jgi:hypothetical protein
MFFKVSGETEWASTTMSDGLHIVAVSTSELGVYSIMLDSAMFLQPDTQFAAYVDNLPMDYNADAYKQFIKTYGTHYVSAGTLGGRASMRTVISHDFFSTQSDSNISAQVRVTWDKFGGGGGGGSSSNTANQRWDQSTVSSTETVGGDPAIKSFTNATEWTAWAVSVETTSPVLTSIALEPLWSLMVDVQKQINMKQAVAEYASNETFPAAALSNYTMSWCDCYYTAGGSNPQGVSACANSAHANDACKSNGCDKDGFFVVSEATWDRQNNYGKQTGDYACCRPCFTAQN